MSFDRVLFNPIEYTHDSQKNKGAYNQAAVWGEDDTNPKLSSRPIYYLDAEGNEQQLNSVDTSNGFPIYYVEIQNGDYVNLEGKTIKPYAKFDTTSDPISYAVYELINNPIKKKRQIGDIVPGTYRSAEQMKPLYDLPSADQIQMPDSDKSVADEIDELKNHVDTLVINPLNFGDNTLTESNINAIIDELSNNLEMKANLLDYKDDITINIPDQAVDLPAADDIYDRIIFNKNSKIKFKFAIDYRVKTGLIISDKSMINVIVTTDATDKLVEADPQFTGCFMKVERGDLPTLDCKFDQRGFGDEKSDGYYCLNGSGKVNKNCGVINSSGTGVYGNNSNIYAVDSLWTGSAARAGFFTRTGDYNFEGANFDDACDADYAEETAVSARRAATLHAQGASIKNSKRGGLSAIRASSVNIEAAEIENCVGDLVAATTSSIVNARLVKIKQQIETENASLYASSGATISCLEAEIERSGNLGINLYATDGGKVSGQNVKLSGGEYNIRSIAGFIDAPGTESEIKEAVTNVFNEGGKVVLNEASIIDADDFNIRCTAGTVDARATTITGAGDRNILCADAGKVNACRAIVKDSDNLDCQVSTGGTINLNEAETTNGNPSIDDVNLSEFNVLNSFGIITA